MTERRLEWAAKKPPVFAPSRELTAVVHSGIVIEWTFMFGVDARERCVIVFECR